MIAGVAIAVVASAFGDLDQPPGSVVAFVAFIVFASGVIQAIEALVRKSREP